MWLAHCEKIDIHDSSVHLDCKDRLRSRAIEVTDGLVVREGVSVTWSVLSWSGGREFEPWSGGTWGV